MTYKQENILREKRQKLRQKAKNNTIITNCTTNDKIKLHILKSSIPLIISCPTDANVANNAPNKAAHIICPVSKKFS